MQRKFRGTVREGGNATVVTVPKALIESGIFEHGRRYEFIGEPVEDEDVEE